MSSRNRSTMKATVAPCAGGTGPARSRLRRAGARSILSVFLTAAFDTGGASDIVLQSFYTHSPRAGSEGIGREGNAMLIGKPGAARTAISAASSDRIMVRGRDLANDLMGRTSFTEYVFLLATGRAPTEEQRFFLDLSLVALAEHGLTPSVQAARMTYDADPGGAPGRDRRRRARLRHGHPGHGGPLPKGDRGRARLASTPAGRWRSPRSMSRANIASGVSRSPDMAIRCISPSIRAPSA